MKIRVITCKKKCKSGIRTDYFIKEACIIITEKSDYIFLSPKSLKRLVIMSKQGKASTLDPIQHQEMLQCFEYTNPLRRVFF
jgi:hypothetical protein